MEELSLCLFCVRFAVEFFFFVFLIIVDIFLLYRAPIVHFLNVTLFLTCFLQVMCFCSLEFPSPLLKVLMFPLGSCSITLCFLLFLFFFIRSSQYRYLPAPYQSKAPYLSYLLVQLVPKQWWLIRCYILVT